MPRRLGRSGSPGLCAAGRTWILVAAAGCALAPFTAARAQTAKSPGSDQLPTPLGHYEDFDAEAAVWALLPRISQQLDASTLAQLVDRMGRAADGERPDIPPEQIAALLAQLDLETLRRPAVELLIHASNVLDLIPEGAEDWLPLVHDSLLVVLEGMSIERIRELILEQASLAPDADRGDRILAFGARTPTFQKIGQILARSPALPADLRAPLQTLESDIVTTNVDDLRALVGAGLGEATLREYQLELEDEVLSEASVGAVIGGSVVRPGDAVPQPVVVKVIKAYAIEAIREDLRSIDTLLVVLEDNRSFYGIGATPLVDMFQEVRASLAREIEAADERANLRRAREYFGDDPRVLVPWVCQCSSEDVTVMQRMEGHKVTDAYVDEPDRRRRLARRLADVMMYDVMFAPAEALFHGDPHAGNVFFSGTDADPYRIALLDWGLLGDLTFDQRKKLVQIGLGLQLKHADRLRSNMDALCATPIDLEADAVKIDGIVSRIFDAARQAKEATGVEPGTLELFDNLVSELARAGYTVDGDVLLYVKSLYTILSVISDLDPEFEAGPYMSRRVKGQVFRELPKRLGNTVWIPGMWSHDYPSLASNADVWASGLNSIGLRFKAIGVGIWKGISFPFR